jgi:pilus assembly protein HofN
MLTVNLLPWRLQRWQRQRQQHLMLLVSCAGLCSLILLLCGWRGYLVDQQQQAEQRQLTQRIGELDQQLIEQQRLLLQRDALVQTQRRQQMRQLQHLAWQQFWQQLPELMPAGLWLNRVERRQGQLVLEGLASGMAEISDFRRLLAKHSLFPVIRQGNVQRQPEGHYSFTLRAQVAEVNGE